jgi:hypothetical protein
VEEARGAGLLLLLLLPERPLELSASWDPSPSLLSEASDDSDPEAVVASSSLGAALS